MLWLNLEVASSVRTLPSKSLLKDRTDLVLCENSRPRMHVVGRRTTLLDLIYFGKYTSPSTQGHYQSDFSIVSLISLRSHGADQMLVKGLLCLSSAPAYVSDATPQPPTPVVPRTHALPVRFLTEFHSLGSPWNARLVQKGSQALSKLSSPSGHCQIVTLYAFSFPRGDHHDQQCISDIQRESHVVVKDTCLTRH